MQQHKIKKGSMVTYVILLVVAIAAMFLIKSCNGSGSAFQGKEFSESGGDTLDVAIEYSPLSLYSYADTLGGFHYDLLRLVSRIGDRPMKFHPIVSLNHALNGLEKGGFDVIAMQYPVTKSHRNEVAFTNAVMLDRQVLVQLTDSASGEKSVKSQLDLAHKAVWVVRDSPMIDRLQGLSREIGDSIIIKQDSVYGPEQLVMKVATGEIKYAVINEHIARAMAERYPRLDMSTNISFSQLQSWVVRHNDKQLLDSLNSWIDRAKASKEFKTIEKKYLK